jgi:hypothetical protein
MFQSHLIKLNHRVLRKKLLHTYGAPSFAPGYSTTVLGARMCTNSYEYHLDLYGFVTLQFLAFYVTECVLKFCSTYCATVTLTSFCYLFIHRNLQFISIDICGFSFYILLCLWFGMFACLEVIMVPKQRQNGILGPVQ